MTDLSTFTLCICKDETINREDCTKCEKIECTEKQRKFAWNYANGKSGTKSYQALGTDCNYNSARYSAVQYMKQEVVQKLIKYHKILLGRKHLTEFESIAHDLYEESRVNAGDLKDDEGNLLRPEEMSEATRRVIKVKHKARKTILTEQGVHYQPTLFKREVAIGDSDVTQTRYDEYDTEIEFDPKEIRKSRSEFLQLAGILMRNKDDDSDNNVDDEEE